MYYMHAMYVFLSVVYISRYYYHSVKRIIFCNRFRNSLMKKLRREDSKLIVTKSEWKNCEDLWKNRPL